MNNSKPDKVSPPLHDKSIVLHLAEDVKRVAKALHNAAAITDERDMLAAADVMLDTIDAAYALKHENERLTRIIERVCNLAGHKWPTDRLTYPDSEIGRYAATAVRLCEDELREALHG